MALSGAVAWGLAQVWPSSLIALPSSLRLTMVAALAVLGLLLNLLPKLAFGRAVRCSQLHQQHCMAPFL